MKNRTVWMIALVLMIAAIALPAAAAAESDRETFLENFEAVYPANIGGVIDSANPYTKSVRIVKTTQSGISVMLDKVLVTEDELAVSFLISGDFPENLFDVHLYTDINVSPLVPYPPELSFEPQRGGGGGDPVYVRVVNENPLVALDTATIALMYDEGYVSAADPIRVHIRIPQIDIGWDYSEEEGNAQYYHEDEVLEFEFETDGAELAAQTKTFDLDHTFEIDGKTYEFHRLHFNPMQLILFTGEMSSGFSWEYTEGVRYVIAATDDGNKINLNAVEAADCPYRGFRAKILDPEVIRSLERTKTLTLTPCYLPDQTNEDPNSYPLWENPAMDCSPERAVTVNIQE